MTQLHKHPPVSLGMLGDDVTDITESHTRFAHGDGLGQAVVRGLDQLLACLVHLAHHKRLQAAGHVHGGGNGNRCIGVGWRGAADMAHALRVLDTAGRQGRARPRWAAAPVLVQHNDSKGCAQIGRGLCARSTGGVGHNTAAQTADGIAPQHAVPAQGPYQQPSRGPRCLHPLHDSTDPQAA